jgi:hypothetical protein
VVVVLARVDVVTGRRVVVCFPTDVFVVDRDGRVLVLVGRRVAGAAVVTDGVGGGVVGGVDSVGFSCTWQCSAA